jgi:hypothetical protein
LSPFNQTKQIMKHFLKVIVLFVAVASTVSAQTPVNDASMYKLQLPAYSEFKTMKLMGVFKNNGTDTLKSVTISWKVNNGTVHQLEKTGLTVSRLQTWPFTAEEDLVLNAEGSITVKAWVSMPNGVTDENHSNDTLTQTIQVIEKYPERHMLIEEVTGAWCGYCPRAPIIYRVNVQPVFPNTIFTAVHSGDGMVANESKDFQNTYVTGVPCGFVDRKRTSSDAGIDFAPEDWLRLLNNFDNKFTPVDIHVYNYYEPATRNWKIDVVADFVFDMTANYRMNCYIIEDSLYGTGSAWDQRNFFNGGASVPYMSLQGAGDPLPGYKHNHVVRKMLGGSWGQAGIIPATVKRGDRYVYSTTFKADSKWKMENVHIVGIVQQYDADKFKRPIINSVEGEVELLTGTETVVMNSGFKVYPNPVSDFVGIEFNLESNADCQLQVLNSLGQEAWSKSVSLQTGKQRQTIPMVSFPAGIYFIRLATPGKVYVERLVKD